jgi:hypothetical protein
VVDGDTMVGVEAAEGGLSELGDAGEGDVDATGLVGNNSSDLGILRSISSRIANVDTKFGLTQMYVIFIQY